MTDKPGDWPYEAYRDDPLTARRIAAVPNAWPAWAYIVAVDLDEISVRTGDGPTPRPDERETAMLGSFLQEYLEHWYGDSPFRQRMGERPFDIDGGANGVIFRKWGENDWSYQRRTWLSGYFPGPPWVRDGRPGLSLEQVMDHAHGSRFSSDAVHPRWATWKAAHPDVFGVPS